MLARKLLMMIGRATIQRPFPTDPSVRMLLEEFIVK